MTYEAILETDRKIENHKNSERVENTDWYQNIQLNEISWKPIIEYTGNEADGAEYFEGNYV